MLKKIFSYISFNLSEEIHNLPLFIPVIMGIGIGYYFHLYAEPKTWVIYSLFIVSFCSVIFINFGNSSDKFKYYKSVVAFSTFKYIFKKLFKILLFTLLFPIVGHITLFILIGGWIVSIFEYSRYIRYFALIYDNSLMHGIWKFLKFVLNPVIVRIKRLKIFSYTKNVIKTSKSKKSLEEKSIKLFIVNTQNLVRFVVKIFKSFLQNPLFVFIQNIRKHIIKTVKKFTKHIIKNIPENKLNTVLNIGYFLNLILFFFILGLFVVKLKTNLLNTKLLQTKLKNQKIIARVISSEIFEQDYRFTFDNVKIVGYDDLKLNKIRVKFSKNFGLPEIGKTLEFTATLIPPFEPDNFGGFNFARYSYFKKLSASGRSFDLWIYSENQMKNNFFDKLFFDFLNFRNKINKLIEQKTSYDTSGIIMSMMTGERYSISDKVSNIYNRAGISHLLAISGFHMTLIVGFAFFLLRFLLSFSLSFSNKYNSKKIAVIFAFMVSLFYLFISGARLPTQRAFLMSSLVLGAILLDRNPLSVRFISVSAIVILLFSPDALVNAGFQMSFVAVVSLIKLYSLKDKFFIKYNKENKVIKNYIIKIFNILLANSLTAFFIGVAIIPFVIYNFNTVQVYSVLGNFFAIPLFSFVVMPAVLFSFLLMPFNGEYFFLKIVEYGIKMINYFAYRVSVLPYASIDVKSISLLSLLFIIFGMIWLLLWERKWKRFGVIPIAMGIVFYIFSAQPNIFVNKYGNIFAVNKNNNMDIVNLSKYKVPDMLISDWNKSVGVKNLAISDKVNFEINNVKVIFIDKYKDYMKACFENSIIFTTFDKTKAFFNCKRPVFDRRFFKYSKGAEFFITPSFVRYRILRNYIGKRPWSLGNMQDKDDGNFPDFKYIKLFNYKS